MAELSHDEAARYVRQIMLDEVGAAGQVALLRGEARVGGDRLAESYALRAGVGRVAEGALDLDTLAPPDIVRHPAARRALASARGALGEIRRILDEGERE